jgi:hypothetical protein
MSKDDYKYDDEAAELAIRQRRFYMNLNPAGRGAEIAEAMGYLSPGDDGVAHEVRDSVQHWLKVSRSGGIGDIMDLSWWMARLMDPTHRFSKEDLDERHSELISFVGAVLYELIDSGVVEWVEDPDIPDIVMDIGDLSKDERHILDKLEQTITKEGKNDGK